MPRTRTNRVKGNGTVVPDALSPLPIQPAPAETAIDPQTAKSPSSASDESHQPAPALPVPQFQTFGPDPSTFDDPTIYHIRDTSPGMPDEEKENIYGVAQYPHDDLHDLTPGTPPDRDFSNAKPPNQATATTFANYLEPYVRPMAEEDIAFLRERVGRVNLRLPVPSLTGNHREIVRRRLSSLDVETVAIRKSGRKRTIHHTKMDCKANRI